VDYYFLVLFSLFFLIAFRGAFGRGADGPSWETNWRGLDHVDRVWIAAATHTKGSRTKLEEQGEVDLAKGYSRRQRRRDSYFVLAIMPPLIGLTVLILTGVLSDSALSWPLVAIGVIPWLTSNLRERRAKARYRAVQGCSSQVPHMTTSDERIG
jgi:hypothetical protein